MSTQIENVTFLVVLVGPPGSGKTTWARRHGRGAVHVSQDDLIDAITPHGFEHVYRPVYAAAEDAVARAGLESGHTVLVDRTNRTRTHRERWLRFAREFACPAIAVEMTTSAAICRERNRLRTDHRRLSEERMERMIAAMQPVEADEGFAAIYDADTIDLAEILQKEENYHEYCHKAR